MSQREKGRETGYRIQETGICINEEGTGLTPWSLEVQDVSILLEHVDLLNTTDGGNVELLECRLEFSVVSLGCGLGLFDDFTSGGTFSACEHKIVIVRRQWGFASTESSVKRR